MFFSPKNGLFLKLWSPNRKTSFIHLFYTEEKISLHIDQLTLPYEFDDNFLPPPDFSFNIFHIRHITIVLLVTSNGHSPPLLQHFHLLKYALLISFRFVSNTSFTHLYVFASVCYGEKKIVSVMVSLFLRSNAHCALCKCTVHCY